jgi:hypothetical protein
VTVVFEPAFPIVNVFESALPSWFASPGYVYDAVAVPALVLSAYTASGVRPRPPAPVIATVHGVSADPVYVTLAGQLMVVVELALSIVKVAESELPSWFASPG